ncbi:hypothetical protein VC83_07933 [Pseudogymnoascus destructans]|uniref:Uncharacterized protein n=2 Tax=Pseudogymnoascus destructans TaxID=655981 RepID=L8GBS6_PSED2|nr:uncharacterized protein VC83_07933 [Pseudogymnoascus destructans]ELR10339.1 hypothetical protein GMDG_04721 [Pseudogymnoascus destructans 20631-21]OAF56002.1 hypothetical protein VC83_07933 [Pseudogymnoascus destructans]
MHSPPSISRCYISLLTTRNSSSLPLSGTLHPSCDRRSFSPSINFNFLRHRNGHESMCSIMRAVPRVLILDAIDALYSAVSEEHKSAIVLTTEPKIAVQCCGTVTMLATVLNCMTTSAPRLILDAIDVPAGRWMLDQGAPA